MMEDRICNITNVTASLAVLHRLEGAVRWMGVPAPRYVQSNNISNEHSFLQDRQRFPFYCRVIDFNIISALLYFISSRNIHPVAFSYIKAISYPLGSLTTSTVSQMYILIRKPFTHHHIRR